MKDDDAKNSNCRNKSLYSRLRLPTYLKDVVGRSERAETSRIQDMASEIRPTHISHLAIVTDNFDVMADWWQVVLNAKPSLKADGMRFLGFDNEHHKIVVFENRHVARRKSATFESGGMHHIAFSYASFEDLVSTYRRLKDIGILPWRAINHGTSFALDYHDPDFNTCELQCSCFPDQPEKPALNEWLKTGAFNRNPIGVMFDIEDAIRAFESGHDVAEIVSPYVMRVGTHSVVDLQSGEIDQTAAAPGVFTKGRQR
ncbi:VOC family protein [Paraburkholderia agricolaris]|uniref:VOC family protein n=1 Tax=Paraburkholderia agricolaris TaxID=2152888 RepID=A0ABW9A1Y6_9BURK